MKRTLSCLLMFAHSRLALSNDIDLNGVSDSFNAASGIPSADITLVISVLLFVATSIYASIKSITLSISAIREGNIIAMLIGLLLIGCLFVMIGSLL